LLGSHHFGFFQRVSGSLDSALNGIRRSSEPVYVKKESELLIKKNLNIKKETSTPSLTPPFVLLCFLWANHEVNCNATTTRVSDTPSDDSIPSFSGYCKVTRIHVDISCTA